MAKLTATVRKALPKSKFGLPGVKGKGGKNKAGKGGYPMPDKAHARVAKSYASRFATPDQKAKIDAKANKVLGSSKIGQRYKKNVGKGK